MNPIAKRSMLTATAAATIAVALATLPSSAPPVGTVFNAKDYGWDVQATINAATAATAAQTAPVKGAVAYFPAGIYPLTSTPKVRGTDVTVLGDHRATIFQTLYPYEGPALDVGPPAADSDVSPAHRPPDPLNVGVRGYRTCGDSSVLFYADRMQLGGGPGGAFYYAPSGWKSNLLKITTDLERPAGVTWPTNAVLRGFSDQDGLPSPWCVTTGNTQTQLVLKLLGVTGLVSCVTELDPTKTRWGALCWTVNRSAGTVTFSAGGVPQKVVFVRPTGMDTSIGPGFAFANVNGTEAHLIGAWGQAPPLGGSTLDVTVWADKVEDDLGLVGQLVLDDDPSTSPAATIGVRSQWGDGLGWICPTARPVVTTSVRVRGIKFITSHVGPSVVVGEVLDVGFTDCSFQNGMVGVAFRPGLSRYPITFVDCDGSGDDTAFLGSSSLCTVRGGTWKSGGRDTFRLCGASYRLSDIFVPSIGGLCETVVRMVRGSGSNLEVAHFLTDREGPAPPTMTSYFEHTQSPDNTNAFTLADVGIGTLSPGVRVADLRGSGWSQQWRPVRVRIEGVTIQDSDGRPPTDPFLSLTGPTFAHGTADFSSMPSGSGIAVSPPPTPTATPASVAPAPAPTLPVKTVGPASMARAA